MIYLRLMPTDDFTKFVFPIAEQKEKFLYIVKECFDKGKSANSVWEHFILRRDEPMKTSNIIELDDTGIIAFDNYSFSKLEKLDLFNNDLECLPLQTDIGEFKVLNILKFVDCLDKENSELTLDADGKILNYTSLKFYNQKLNGIHFFKVPELPKLMIVSFEVLDECMSNSLLGLELDMDINKL